MVDFLSRHWTLLVGAAAWLFGVLQNRWHAAQENAAMSWPSAMGIIEASEVCERESKSNTWYEVELRYSYKVEGEYYSGRYKRKFDDEESADAFAKGMQGSPITVRYQT